MTRPVSSFLRYRFWRTRNAFSDSFGSGSRATTSRALESSILTSSMRQPHPGGQSLSLQTRRNHPWGAPRRSARGIVLFEPRMLPAVRAPVTTFVTIPTRSISRYGGRWVNLLPWRDGASQEGELHDARRMQGPSDVDIQRDPDGGGRLVHGSERNPHSKRRRHRTSRHLPDLRSPQEDAMPVSRDPSILHADADKPPIVVPRPLPFERIPSDEVVIPLHKPFAVHLERGLMPVEILAREQVSFFQPERVPRAEADRPDAEVLAGFQDRRPDAQALRRGGKELEPRLTGIPSPRRKEGGPSIGNGGLSSMRHGGVRGPAPPPPLDFRWNRPRRGPPGRRGHEVEDRTGKGSHAGEVYGREPL